MAHFRHLEKLLRRRGRSREDAEDLIQENFLRVKMYVDGGGEIRELEAFLVRTALNLSRDAHKHEHRRLYARTPVDELVIPSVAPTPDEVLDAEDRLECLKRVLNKAGPRLILNESPLRSSDNYRSIRTIVKDGALVDRDSLPIKPILTKPMEPPAEEDASYVPFLVSSGQFPMCPLYMLG